ncbi:MAG TPA: glycosyltransferase family 61 protein [Promineifilum sp.]|nr:glycosyltransferase family 61 protein [Promineifilum sp.]
MGSTATQATNARQNGTAVTEVPLSSADFHFAFHPNPDRIFDRAQRPFRLMRGKPSIKTYTNAIYAPAFRTAKQKLGCLYDESGNRIEASITRRNRSDMVYNTDPLRFEGNAKELPVYDRPVLYLGFLYSHFSHFMIETLGHWWGLTEELGGIDRYLIHISDTSYLERSYVKAAMDALGITRDQLVFFDQPTRLSRVVVPANSVQIHSHIYTSYKDIFNKLSLALGAADVAPTERAVFLSRSKDKHGVRRYHGEEEIEAFLAERGVTIAHPGQLPFREQVKLINEHSRIIGFQGGQMLNIAFALQPKEVVYLTDNRVWGSSLLTDICFDHSSTYVKVADTENVLREMYRAVIRRTTGKRVKTGGFSRGHTVDLDRTTAWLAQMLASDRAPAR